MEDENAKRNTEIRQKNDRKKVWLGALSAPSWKLKPCWKRKHITNISMKSPFLKALIEPNWKPSSKKIADSNVVTISNTANAFRLLAASF